MKRRDHRRKLIAGNWKMNGLLAEAMQFVADLKENPAPEHVEVALMPPYTLLHPLHDALEEKGIRLGAQNVYFESKGAFTGSISAMMLRDAGCHYVILGHSERRNIMGETDKVEKAKLAAAWSAGLEPILCIGESLEQRKAGETNQHLHRQLQVLKDAPDNAPLTVAYEPIWAIGTGLTPTPEQIVETHAYIHEVLGDLNIDCRVLYGGSANPDNAKDILSCRGVEGLLVGGASLKAESFSRMIAAAADVAGSNS